jgi:hypothetical protein
MTGDHYERQNHDHKHEQHAQNHKQHRALAAAIFPSHRSSPDILLVIPMQNEVVSAWRSADKSPGNDNALVVA